MKELTTRQREILDYITRSIRERGYPPTIREIGKHMRIRSTNGVNDHLKALERKGFLLRDELKSRAMRPVHMDEDLLEVPIYGRVAAGLPSLAVEHVEDTVKVDRFLFGEDRNIFGLRIVGESMIEDGIMDGDLVFIRKSPQATSGSIVIALIENEATCKRYYPEGSRIRFQPANSEMRPIYVSKQSFKETMILGEVIGVLRKY